MVSTLPYESHNVLVRVVGFGKRILLAVCASAALATAPAVAEPVTLTSPDGKLQMTGEIVSIENGIYTVATAIGMINIGVNQVVCTGDACPVIAGDDDDEEALEFDYDLSIAASAGIADQLLPVVAEGIAIGRGASAVALDSNGEPLPEDIGRPLPGGARDDDDDAEGGEEEGEADVISILMRKDDDDDVIAAYAVTIAEEEDAIEELAEGDVEIIFLDEPAEDDLVAQVSAAGGGNITAEGQERVIAVEGVIIAVSPDNTIAKLNVEDLAPIFSGQITNWAELGGQDAPINVYSFDESNAAFHYIEEMILEEAEAELSEDALVVQTMRELTSKVSADPNGIGVVPYTSQRGTRAVPIESSCGIVATPSPFNIKNEEYLLNRRFYAYSRNDPSPAAQEFLAFLDSSELDGLVEKAGFIDLSVIEEHQSDAAAKVQEMILSTQDTFELGILRNLMVDMLSSIRLSTAFRFSLGDAGLDARARTDLERIASYIETARPAEVIFVGFTDSVGSFDANARLSVNRALSVQRAVTAALSPEAREATSFSAVGYGELAPIACNDTAYGRRVNRRVEVWLR